MYGKGDVGGLSVWVVEGGIYYGSSICPPSFLWSRIEGGSCVS